MAWRGRQRCTQRRHISHTTLGNDMLGGGTLGNNMLDGGTLGNIMLGGGTPGNDT